LTAATILQIQGAAAASGAASGDITAKSSIIEWQAAAP
jgi:hypothetical protein